MQSNSQPQSLPTASTLQVEAARYALLRRLAYAMRHHMVVHLQPIGMITEVIERRLQAQAPDLAQVQENMAKINGFSRAAVQACLEVVSWLAPDAPNRVALDSGVLECLALLRSNFSFRGFTFVEQIASVPMTVDRAALRNVLPACLLALTDHAASPAQVVISAEVAPGQAVISLRFRQVEGTAGFPGDPPYRLLHWSEVEAMATADGILLTRQGDTARLVLREAAAP